MNVACLTFATEQVRHVLDGRVCAIKIVKHSFKDHERMLRDEMHNLGTWRSDARQRY